MPSDAMGSSEAPGSLLPVPQSIINSWLAAKPICNLSWGVGGWGRGAAAELVQVLPSPEAYDRVTWHMDTEKGSPLS